MVGVLTLLILGCEVVGVLTLVLGGEVVGVLTLLLLGGEVVGVFTLLFRLVRVFCFRRLIEVRVLLLFELLVLFFR